jgi:NAD(P)H-dependent FMN reductase
VSYAFRNKPIVAVGYSNGIAGGVRAIEHLAQIAVEGEMVPLRTAVVIPRVGEAFNERGVPVDPATDVSLRIALDDLAWWSAALERARAGGELPPAGFRMRAALAATHPVDDLTV